MFELCNIILEKNEIESIFKLFKRTGRIIFYIVGENQEFKTCVLSDDMNILYNSIRKRVMCQLEDLSLDL